MKQSCIDTRHGTFLARNIYTPYHINKASSYVYGIHYVEQTKCLHQQQSICNEQQYKSDQLYRTDMATIRTLQMRQNESIKMRNIISKCIDMAKKDIESVDRENTSMYVVKEKNFNLRQLNQELDIEKVYRERSTKVIFYNFRR